MLGILDVGGGNRGSYGAGVMDHFIEKHIFFDYGIGVSAGSANLISFFAGQRGRNYHFYTEYNLRREAMSFSSFLKNGNYVNVEYIYGTITNRGGENPLDFESFLKSGSQLWIVATDALTGKPVYFDGRRMKQDDYGALKASSNLPCVNKPSPWRGGLYYDGGISDPVPIEQALRAGCDKVVVILTTPRDDIRTDEKDKLLAGMIKKKYPRAAEAFIRSSAVYNAEVERCRQLEKEGKVRIIAPDSIGHMKTLGQSAEDIKKLYAKGYADAVSAFSFLHADAD